MNEHAVQADQSRADQSTADQPTDPADECRRPLRADAERNRERLLAAARAAFAEHGGEASLEDIARQAGVGIGTLYRHFPTRQHLHEATYLDQADELWTRAEDLIDYPSPLDAVVIWLRSQLEFGRTGKSLGASVMSAKHQDGSEINLACVRMREAGAALLRRAQEAGEVRPGIELPDLLRLMHGIVLVDQNSPEDPERAGRMFDLVMAGLRPAAPAAPAATPG